MKLVKRTIMVLAWIPLVIVWTLFAYYFRWFCRLNFYFFGKSMIPWRQAGVSARYHDQI